MINKVFNKKRFVVLSLMLLFAFVFSESIYAGGSNTSSRTGSNERNQLVPQEQSENELEEIDESVNMAVTGSLTQLNWPDIIAGAALGWLLGLGSVWVVDKLKEPKLVFEVGSVADKHPTQKWRFIHLKIKNLKRLPGFNPFTQSPAFECKAQVKIEDKAFVGRWTSKEQPIGSPADVINKALVHPRETIHPYTAEFESVELSVGLKYEKEDEFYGFNNESYLHTDLKNNGYRFGKGVFKGKVIISTLGQTYSQEFEIHNKSKHRKDFWIKLI